MLYPWHIKTIYKHFPFLRNKPSKNILCAPDTNDLNCWFLPLDQDTISSFPPPFSLPVRSRLCGYSGPQSLKHFT